MPKHPLAEVFGFPTTNLRPDAQRYRNLKLCPFHNRVPNCTKDKADNPLGVCSIFDGDDLVITCPVRFRQDWLVAEDAAAFFFPPGTTWTSLVEVCLNDASGKSAGNIDLVLVAYDKAGQITDFGALEIQAVYISGNIRRAFEYYLLARHKIVYTTFEESLNQITKPEIGDPQEFMRHLQLKLNEKLNGNAPPDTTTIEVNI